MSGVRYTRLSSGSGPRPPWSLALFAHNEAPRVVRALDALGAAAATSSVEIVVLANGCTDGTADEVRRCAARVPWLGLVEIDVPDKAHAWNVYVHDLLTDERAHDVTTHFFVDADVVLAPFALDRLDQALAEVPDADAAGGMPATGRDRHAWRARMAASGTLAGALYALRGRFVRQLRNEQIRIPTGFIGDDWFVSWAVATLAHRGEWDRAGVRCVFQPDAEFSFRSLSPWRARDTYTYVRRQWRYALRTVQFEMLTTLVRRGVRTKLPENVEALYRDAPIPSRLRWIGRHTLWRAAAVQWVRVKRTRSRNGT